MNLLNIIYHTARADFYERTRRYSFLITIGIMIYLVYQSMPPATADYLVIAHEDYRGIYNSAWVGSSVALLCSVFLGLFGFYLVKNTIERDSKTGVGQIIATTPLSKLNYFIGKMVSNFLYLFTIVLIISLGSIVMQFIRGESYEIDLVKYFSPILFSSVPVILIVSAMALFFETIKWIKGGIGNVLYYFIYIGVLVFSIERNEDMAKGEDVIGPFAISQITTSMREAVKENFPDYNGSFNLGGYEVKDEVKTFEWQGAKFTKKEILWRFIWIGFAFVIISVASVFFRRFDPSLDVKKVRKKNKQKIPVNDEIKNNELNLKNIKLTPLVKEKANSIILAYFILKAELKLMLKGINIWWYILTAGFIIGGITSPYDTALQFLIPVGFIMPLLIWSKIGNREMQHQTNQYMFAVPSPVGRQLPVVWLAGFIVTLLAGIAWPVRILFAGNFELLIPYLIGCAFVPTLAMAFGTITNSSRLFEIVYFFLWYLGLMEKVSVFDFIGLTEKTLSSEIFSYYLLLIPLLFIIGVLGRKKQICI